MGPGRFDAPTTHTPPHPHPGPAYTDTPDDRSAQARCRAGRLAAEKRIQ